MNWLQKQMKDPKTRIFFKEEEIIENFLNKVDELLTCKKITRKILANGIGCTASNVTQIMQRKNGLTISTMIKIAEFLNLDLEFKIIERKTND